VASINNERKMVVRSFMVKPLPYGCGSVTRLPSRDRRERL
jgi:hypothetical protein